MSTFLNPLDFFPTFYNMQSVSSNAVANAINDAFRVNLQYYTHFSWQGWTNSHSYTINLEGNYLLICANPNINSSAIYFIKGGHTTITSLVGYANTILAPQYVGYNINVNRTSLTITGDYCTTALMQIGT